MATQPQAVVVETGTAERSPDAAPAPAKLRVTPRRSRIAGKNGGSLQSELRRFAAERSAGWNHEEWIALLGTLNALGIDTSDADAIGLALERERLGIALEGIPGLGERRRGAILERYARLWDLRQANADEIAGLAGLNAGLARRILDALR